MAASRAAYPTQDDQERQKRDQDEPGLAIIKDRLPEHAQRQRVDAAVHQLRVDLVGQRRCQLDERIDIGQRTDRSRNVGAAGEAVQQFDQVVRRPGWRQDLRLLFVEQHQTDVIAIGKRRLGNARGDGRDLVEHGFARRAEANRLRRVDEERATDGHVALEFLDDEPVAAGGGLPGDHLRRIAGPIVAQVVQFAAAAGLPQPVQSGRRQDVVRFRRSSVAFGVGQGRKHEIDIRLADKRAVVKQTV